MADRLGRLNGVFLVFVASVLYLLIVLRVVVTLSRSGASLVDLGRVRQAIRVVDASVRTGVEVGSFLLGFNSMHVGFAFVLRNISHFRFDFG